MHYFCYIGNTYSLHNKLEKDVFEVLKGYDRYIVSDTQVEEFKLTILKNINACIANNPRCKSITKPYWHGKSSKSDPDEDFSLQLGSGAVCNLYLYKSKN